MGIFDKVMAMKPFKYTIFMLTLLLTLGAAEVQASLVTNLINNFRAQGLTAQEVVERAAQYNITAQDLLNAGYTVKDLEQAGFSAQDLKAAGVTADELRSAGFTTEELSKAGFSAADLRAAGFTINDLQAAGYSLRDITRAGYSITELRSAGVSVTEFKASGFNATELKKAGISERELYLGGYTAAQLKSSGSTASDLKTAGVSTNELLAAGYSTTDLKNAGFTANELRNSGLSYTDLKNAGFSANELSQAGATAQDLRSLGYSFSEMHASGLSASQLKAAGASAQDLKSLGLSAADVIAAGFTAQELSQAGYTTRDLKDAGTPLAQLVALGVSATELKNLGYSAEEMRNAGVSANALKASGYSNQDLLNANYSLNELKAAGASAEELKNLGVSLRDLQNAGFSGEQLISAGFTIEQIREQGASLSELLAQGATPQELLSSGQADVRDLMNAGVSINELRSSGVNDADLRAAGATLTDLKQAGANAQDLLGAGASVSELRNAGFSTQELVNSGHSIAGLLEGGLSVSELQGAGVSTRELVSNGASTQDLINAGVSVDELLRAGVSAESLAQSGASTRNLLAAGVDAKELLAQGVSTKELLDSGASVNQLIQAGAGVDSLISAGASSKDLVQAGVSTAALKDQGISAEELKLAGASNESLIQAGYSPNDLLRAGLSTQDMVRAGADPADLKNAGISDRALLDAGVTPAKLAESGASLEDLIRAGVDDRSLRRAGFTTEQIETAKVGASSGGSTGGQAGGGLEDFIRSELVAQVLNDGNACVESSGSNNEANRCRSAGRIWNCDMGVCYTEAYRTEMLTSASQCVERESDPTRQNACLDGVKNKAVRDVASGSLCDRNTNEAIQCAASGRVYNCNVGQCLTIAQNQSLTGQVERCYQGQDPEVRNQCMKQVEQNVAVDLLTNCSEQQSSVAIQCRSSGNRSYNCLANACLDKNFNDSITDRTKECLDSNDREACLDNIKLDVVRHVASGDSCDKSTSEARQCADEGKVFNCNVGYCLTEKQNQELADAVVNCESIEGGQEAKEACHREVKRDSITRVASGELCDQRTNDAMVCAAQGKVWNCNVNACLSLKENELLTKEIVSCELDSPGETEKNQCYRDMKEGVVRKIASGGNCDPSTPEAKACADEGKFFNCNANFCLTNEQNDVLADEIVKCQMLEGQRNVNVCMAELEDRALDFLMRACDISGNREAQDCKARGRVWNCQVNMCLSEQDHMRLVNAVKNCNAKPSEEEKKACHDELEDMAKMAQNGGGFNSDNIQMPSNPSKIVHGGAVAVGLVGALQGIGASTCKSGYTIAAAGALAMVNEMNTDKSAKSAMDALRQRVKAMEERVKKEDASFELQVEVFDFSLQAIDEGIAIAKEKDSGYGMVLAMYGIALAHTAWEMAMWKQPQIMACGAVNVGVSVGAMATVGLIRNGINKGIADLQRHRAHIQMIRDRFLAHFGGQGALDTDRNRRPPGGGDFLAGQQDPVNLQMNPLAARQRAAGQDIGRPGSSSLPRSCVDNQAKPDTNCNCKNSNTCFQMNDLVGGLDNEIDANMRNTISAMPGESLANDANQILRGDLNAGDLGQAAINSRNKRIFGNLDKLKASIEGGLNQHGKGPMPNQDEAAANAFIDSLVKPEMISQRQMAAQDQDFTTLIDEAPALNDFSEQIRELASGADIPPGAGIMPSFNFDAFDFGNVEGMKLVNQTNEGEIGGAEFRVDHDSLALSSRPDFDYSAVGSQVHGDPDQNIFHIISNRYNVLRLGNRLGNTSSRLQD
jgi:ribosomal protein L13E